MNIETKVFNVIRMQSDFAENLEYAMGEVYCRKAQRVNALASMVDSFIEELEVIKAELAEVE